MAKGIKGPQAVTANRLSDGVVVYLAADGGWAECIESAAVVETAEKASALLEEGERSAAAQQVVAPYLIDVIADGDIVRAARYREVIRALGPTVRRDLGKQADFQMGKE